jgi:hypothetical protein
MSEIHEAIAAKTAELDALRVQARQEERAAELAALADRFQAVATEVGGDVDKVTAFIGKVAEQSGYGVSYLLDVMSGESRVSTERGFWE